MTFDEWWTNNRFTDMMSGVDRSQAQLIWNNATKTAEAISKIVSGELQTANMKITKLKGERNLLDRGLNLYKNCPYPD